MTRQEKHLWHDFLRSYPVKIYKQRIIGDYIADFYCHQARLVIELDGSQHYTTQGVLYDKTRSEYFEKHDLMVLRFSNNDVNENFRAVCGMIDNTINNLLTLLSSSFLVCIISPSFTAFKKSSTLLITKSFLSFSIGEVYLLIITYYFLYYYTKS